MDMMGGTLEVKDEADALKDDLVREDWMDEVPPEKMTDEQEAALEEYEQKVAIVAAAAEKERKALELELVDHVDNLEH